MAKAAVTCTNAAAVSGTASYNMTALTAPGGAFASTQGFVQSDWNYQSSWGAVGRQKTEGSGQLAVTYHAVGGGGNNSLNTVAWTQADEIHGAASGDTSPGCGVMNALVGDYAQWTAIIADQRVRKLKWRGQNSACGPIGTFQVTATMADGSATMTPFNLASGVTGFDLTFAAAAGVRSPTTMTLKIACTAAPAGSAFLFNQLIWLELPAALVVPRGAKRYFLGRGLGGSLA